MENVGIAFLGRLGAKTKTAYVSLPGNAVALLRHLFNVRAVNA